MKASVMEGVGAGRSPAARGRDCMPSRRSPATVFVRMDIGCLCLGYPITGTTHFWPPRRLTVSTLIFAHSPGDACGLPRGCIMVAQPGWVPRHSGRVPSRDQGV